MNKINDYISRQAAIRIAEQGQIQGFEWQFKKLCTLPSAEPERKKGKWIDNRDVSWMCSECGKWLDVLQGDIDMNYCPNCGADMTGGKKNETD